MGERICQESLLIISLAGEGIHAYSSLFAAPTPYPVSTFILSAPCPRKVTLMDSWSLAKGRHCHLVKQISISLWSSPMSGCL